LRGFLVIGFVRIARIACGPQIGAGRLAIAAVRLELVALPGHDDRGEGGLAPGCRVPSLVRGISARPLVRRSTRPVVRGQPQIGGITAFRTAVQNRLSPFPHIAAACLRHCKSAPCLPTATAETEPHGTADAF
jgi:hypothetical protein